MKLLSAHGGSLLERLSLERRAQLRRLGAIPFSRRLGLLATWYGTDKGPRNHAYTIYYQRHLRQRRSDIRSVLEIGVGGRETNSGGASLRMWRSFLGRAEVVGVDIYEKRLPPERRVRIVQGDQSDPRFLAEVVASYGPFDLVIDDGSHRGDDINVSFQVLWPSLNPRGLYIIEDLDTAYDRAYGGGPPGTPNTAMSLLKELLDCVQQHGAHDTATAVHAYASPSSRRASREWRCCAFTTSVATAQADDGSRAHAGVREGLSPAA